MLIFDYEKITAISLSVLFLVLIFMTGGAYAAEPYAMNENVTIGNFSYKVIEAVRKKETGKNDIFNIKISVKNDGFETSAIPPFKLVDESGKEFDGKNEKGDLKSGAMTAVNAEFAVPKEGKYRLKMYGDANKDQYKQINNYAEVDIEPKINDNYEAFKSAMAKGDTKTAKELLAKLDVSYRDSEGNTLLHLAAAANQPEIVKILLKKGIYISIRNKNNDTPLIAACYSESLASAKAILDGGADPTLRNHKNKTALLIAKDKENESLIKLVKGYIY
ncbi:MAG: ankyrin repeat domain-containing protein [Candidatus Wallbacteria bacterium]